MTANQIRLRALVLCGWEREVAKKLARRKHPTTGVEMVALIVWDLKKLWERFWRG